MGGKISHSILFHQEYLDHNDSTSNLQNAISEIGADHIILSMNHSYKDIEEGQPLRWGLINPADKAGDTQEHCN